MKQEQWTAVDTYITDLFVPRDAVLDGALETSTAAGLPPINVALIAIPFPANRAGRS